MLTICPHGHRVLHTGPLYRLQHEDVVALGDTLPLDPIVTFDTNGMLGMCSVGARHNRRTEL